MDDQRLRQSLFRTGRSTHAMAAEKNPNVSVADWEKAYTRPAQYLAKQLQK